MSKGLSFSIIIPIYNRPEELEELLLSLTQQTKAPDEVIVVEDGSTIPADHVVSKYENQLPVKYFVQENSGQGFARNSGYERAKGDYLIVFDSDCIIPKQYLEKVNDFLGANRVDAFGGPDGALDEFTPIQKAINHSMTSFMTTGGIRGSKKNIGVYHPRSFNMGISKEVYVKTSGYLIPFMGEDLEFSARIIKNGFKTALIPEALVYHKRRTSLLQFYKQLRYFGRARINLTRFHPEQLSLIHLFPLMFTLGLLLGVLSLVVYPMFAAVVLGVYVVYMVSVALEALWRTKSVLVSLLAPFATLLQFTGYAAGLVAEWVRKKKGIDPNAPYIDLY